MPRPKALPRILAATDDAPAVLETTAQQAAFVSYYSTAGINGAEAARLAGYAEPRAAAGRLLAKPHVRAAIRAQREAAIHGDLAKMALETLGQLMTAETTPAAVRLGASRTALEMAGHLGLAKDAAALMDRPLAELSVAELQRLVEEGEKALASVNIIPAKVVSPDVTPDGAPVPL